MEEDYSYEMDALHAADGSRQPSGRSRHRQPRAHHLPDYQDEDDDDDVVSAPEYSWNVSFNRYPRSPFHDPASYQPYSDTASAVDHHQHARAPVRIPSTRSHQPSSTVSSGVHQQTRVRRVPTRHLPQATPVYHNSIPEGNEEAGISLEASLKARGFSTGLARELSANALAFANRIWVVDNSGSMVICDGRRIVPAPNGKLSQKRVSRWEELQDTVLYHAEMAGALNSPTVFRLLNDPGPQVGPQEMSVAQRPPGAANVEEDLRRIRTVMSRAKPLGMTPLTSHILQIQQALYRMAPRLRREGKRVAIILATDGLPTDTEGFGGDEITQEFVQALKSLEGLPIWLVIRLCTDEDKVTSFYNDLDGKFELSLEVLDDFLGEAAEVYRYNKWLNYSITLHRCRELGYHDRLFDLIDERPLTKGELRDFCALLLGQEVQQIPDPNIEWKDFLKHVQISLLDEPTQYDPIRKKVLPLIHVRVLNRIYGKRNCTIM